MKGTHAEKAIQRIEALMGEEEQPMLFYLLEPLGERHPAPRTVVFVTGGTASARVQALANWEKSEAARVRRLKRKEAQP